MVLTSLVEKGTISILALLVAEIRGAVFRRPILGP